MMDVFRAILNMSVTGGIAALAVVLLRIPLKTRAALDQLRALDGGVPAPRRVGEFLFSGIAAR